MFVCLQGIARAKSLLVPSPVKVRSLGAEALAFVSDVGAEWSDGAEWSEDAEWQSAASAGWSEGEAEWSEGAVVEW